jgi:selenocysteine-specific elongation factor
MRVIGTAGHVDHGKSTLVKALTGIDPDRLLEEKERQMTIDLGFAWMTLDDGEEVGIVDVPGHRDFIENMLAGIGSIDAVLFVIAADEGIMPQTREHLAILELLEIDRGIIVLTKMDLVDEEWLKLVIEEAKEFLKTTKLGHAPVIPVSAVSGLGLDHLKRELNSILVQTPDRRNLGRPRLSIDRVFSLTGFGTVVTGTLIGGSLEEGQDVELQPKGLKARIRSLQSHKHKRKIALPGARVAINLSGVEKRDISRGDVVTLPGQWETTRIIDAKFSHLPDLDKPLKHNQEVKFYHGATQRMAKVRLIGQTQILPGDDGWIQLILRNEVVVDRRDHFILRRPSPGATLGGGQIADPHPGQRYKLRERTPIKRLEKLLVGNPQDILYEIVRSKEPITYHDLLIEAETDKEHARRFIQSLLADDELIALGMDKELSQSYLMTKIGWHNAQGKANDFLQSFHRQFPLRLGMPIEEFRKRMKLDPKWSNRFLKSAVEEGWLMQEGNFVRAPSHKPGLTKEQARSTQLILEKFKNKPFNTPSRRDILELIDAEILNYLLWSDQLVNLSGDIFLLKETYEYAIGAIKVSLRKKGTITIAEVRDLFQTSRKYALALMEHLDSIGVTTREGDLRKLQD